MELTKKTYEPLDNLIESTGLKYTYIAEQLGKDVSTIYKWRLNPKSMDIRQMEDLANVIGVEFYDVYDVVKNFED